MGHGKKVTSAVAMLCLVLVLYVTALGLILSAIAAR
jgi:hypothetical protein